MSEISQAAASDRESARNPDGTFGTQPAAESGIDLSGAQRPEPPRVFGTQELELLERELVNQLAATRTAMMQAQVASWVNELSADGSIPPAASHLQLIRREDEVNDFGGVDLSPGAALDPGGRELADLDGRASALMSTHGDESGPDLYADGWLDDQDRLDLSKVRSWRPVHTADSLRYGISADMENQIAMDRAQEIKARVREVFPAAATVHMTDSDSSCLTFSHIEDADGNRLHEIYGFSPVDMPDPFDDDVDEMVREMSSTRREWRPGVTTWADLCVEEPAVSKHTGHYLQAVLDLDKVPGSAQ